MPQFPQVAKGAKAAPSPSLHLSIHPSGTAAGLGAPTSSCSSQQGLERYGAGLSSPPPVIYNPLQCRCAAAAPGDIFSPLQGITAAASTREQREGGRAGQVLQREALPTSLLQTPLTSAPPAPAQGQTTQLLGHSGLAATASATGP